MPEDDAEITGLLASPRTTADLDDEAWTPKVAASQDYESTKVPAIDPYEMENLAIVMSYFCVGFGMTFIGTFGCTCRPVACIPPLLSPNKR